MTRKEDCDLGAKDYASDGEQGQGELVAPPTRSRRWTSYCVRQKVTHCQCC